MLELLSLLQARHEWSGRALAERLRVSDRTVRRDVDRLRGLGYHVTAIKGPDGGYRLDPGSELPPLHFDDAQAVAVAVALQVAAATGTADAEAALRALQTVRQVMPSRLRRRVDGLRFTTLASSSAGVSATPPDVLVAVSDAVTSREVLRFDYVPVGAAADAEAARRRVEPHHVVFGEHRWFLVAWDLDAEDWRVFRVDRMQPTVTTGPRFEVRSVPGGDVGTYLTGRLRGARRGDAWPCTGQVVLGLPAHAVAPFVDEGAVEVLAPNRCRLTSGSWSWVSLAASLARFDAPISEVSPQCLVDAFEQLSGRFAEVTLGAGADSAETDASSVDSSTLSDARAQTRLVPPSS